MLSYWLSENGFCAIERVKEFHLGFEDVSVMEYKGQRISLNVIANKCEFDRNALQIFDY